MSTIIWTDKGDTYDTLEAAFASLNGLPGIVYSGVGTINLNSRILLYPGQSLIGNYTTIIAKNLFGTSIGTNYMTNQEGDFMFVNVNANLTGKSPYYTQDSDIFIKDVILDGNKTYQTRKVHGIGLQYVDNIKLINVKCQNFGTFATNSSTQTNEATGNYESSGILFRNCTNIVVDNYSQSYTDSISLTYVNHAIFKNIKGNNSTSSSFLLNNTKDVSINKVDIQVNEGEVVKVTSTDTTAANQSANIYFRNGYINTTNKTDIAPQATADGIKIDSSKYISVVNTNFYAVYGNGLTFSNSNHINVQRNNFEYFGASQVSNAYAGIKLISNGTNYTEVVNINKNTIAKNSLNTNSIYGVNTSFLTGGYSTLNIGENSIDSVAIGINSNNGAIVPSLSVLANDIRNCTTYDIYTSLTKYATIVGNSLLKGLSSGIYMDSSVSGIISNNILSENGTVSVPSDALTLGSTSTNNIVRGNMMYDTKITPTQQYPLNESSGSDQNQIVDNYSFGNNSNTYRVTTTANTLSQRSTEGANLSASRQLVYAKNNTSGNPLGSNNVTRGYCVNYSQDGGFALFTSATDPNHFGITAQSINAASNGFIQTFGYFSGAFATGPINTGDLLTGKNATHRLITATSGTQAVAIALSNVGTGVDTTIPIFIIPVRKV